MTLPIHPEHHNRLNLRSHVDDYNALGAEIKQVRYKAEVAGRVAAALGRAAYLDPTGEANKTARVFAAHSTGAHFVAAQLAAEQAILVAPDSNKPALIQEPLPLAIPAQRSGEQAAIRHAA